MALLFGMIYKDTLRKKIAIYICILVALLSLLLTMFVQPLLQFPSLSFILLAFLVVGLSLFDLTKMLLEPKPELLTKIPAFWMNTGNLIFYSLTFFAFGLNNIGINVLPNWIYDLIFFTNIVLYSMYGWAMVLAARNKINGE